MDINSGFRAFKTLLDIAKDRGYVVSEDYLSIDIDTFRHLYFNDKLDLIIKDHSNLKKKLFIKISTQNKVKPSYIRDLINKIKQDYLKSDSDELIIALKYKPNNSILKICKETNYKICQIFWYDILQFNITKHNLVPKHIKCNNDG